MKTIFFTLFVLNITFIFSQTGISIGPSVIKGFGINATHIGLHVGAEIPRDDEASYMFRLTASPYIYKSGSPLFAYSTDTNNIAFTEVERKIGFNYLTIEGGTRYYIGSGFDYGFSAYGGSMFALMFNGIKAKYGDYDRSKFMLPDGIDASAEKGSILSINLGLSGGIKYSSTFGVFYSDISLIYAIFNTASNQFAADNYLSNYANLNFVFTLGFRKDLY